MRMEAWVEVGTRFSLTSECRLMEAHSLSLWLGLKIKCAETVRAGIDTWTSHPLMNAHELIKRLRSGEIDSDEFMNEYQSYPSKNVKSSPHS